MKKSKKSGDNCDDHDCDGVSHVHITFKDKFTELKVKFYKFCCCCLKKRPIVLSENEII